MDVAEAPSISTAIRDHRIVIHNTKRGSKRVLRGFMIKAGVAAFGGDVPSSEELAEIAAHPFRMLIDGRPCTASDGATLDTLNPALGERLTSIPNASGEDIDRAVKAAKSAQREWKQRTYPERRAAVLKLAAILREHAPVLGALDSLESGNIYSGMRADPVYAADAIEYLCSIGYELKGEATQLDDGLHYTRREPFGVVARLLPFNHPAYGFGVAAAAPLLAGNALIMKPSPHTSLSALLIGELVADVFPPGVLTILTGSNERVAVPLVNHPGIDRLSLVGSTDAGRAVMRAAAERLVPLTLELGGKNALIVFPDADLDLAADTAMAGMNFSWQAASCGSTSRILVHSAVRRAFEERLVARLKALRVRPPFDPAAQMGSISFKALYDRCLAYLESGRRDGARLAVGGEKPSGAEFECGLYLTPALFTDATAEMRIAQEEIFGPIITMIEWSDYDRMIGIANGVPLGLTAAVITDDLNMVQQVERDLDVGYIEVNGPVSWALGSPFGGIKLSGFGREGNLEEIESYTYLKSVNIRRRPSRLSL